MNGTQRLAAFGGIDAVCLFLMICSFNEKYSSLTFELSTYFLVMTNIVTFLLYFSPLAINIFWFWIPMMWLICQAS